MNDFKAFLVFVCGGILLIQMAIVDTTLDKKPEDVVAKEFNIVSLCTDIPNLFYKLMKAYVDKNGENAALIFQNLIPLIERLKKEINAIKFKLPSYTEAAAETDSMTVSVQDQMISVFRKLETSIEKLYAHLVEVAETDNMQIRPTLNRVQIIQDQIKPAIVYFQESCKAEIVDILKNAIQSVDQN